MPALAADAFWEERQRGYYWYEDPIFTGDLPRNEEMPVAENSRPQPDTYTYDEMLTLHPDQLNVVLDSRLKTAVHKPTEDNVLGFLEALDAAKQKSRALANVAGYVASQNPHLTGESRYPYSQPGRSAYLEQRSTEIEQTLEQYRDRYAIIAFNQHNCSFCASQEQILAHFEYLNGWKVRRVDIAQNPSLAARFNVQITPTLLLVSRESQGSKLISSGVIALDQLKKRIYRLVRLMEDKTNPEHFYEMNLSQNP